MAGGDNTPWVATTRTLSAPFFRRSSADCNRPGGVDHVVDDDGVAAFHLADHREGGRDIVLVGFAALVDERHIGIEVPGVLLRPLHTAGVRGNDRGRPIDDILQILDENRQGGEVVERFGDEPLDLTGVEIDRNEPVGAGRHEEIAAPAGPKSPPGA